MKLFVITERRKIEENGKMFLIKIYFNCGSQIIIIIIIRRRVNIYIWFKTTPVISSSHLKRFD